MSRFLVRVFLSFVFLSSSALIVAGDPGGGPPDGVGNPDKPEKPDKPHNPEKPDKPVQARTQLVAPDPAPVEDADGDVRLREWEGRSAIHVFVRHLVQGATYAVKIAKDDVVEEIGTITIVREEDADKGPRCFAATLDGAQEVPPVETDASGLAEVALGGKDRTKLQYQVTVEGLSGPVTAAHIHMAPAGENGEPIYELDAETLMGMIEIE